MSFYLTNYSETLYLNTLRGITLSPPAQFFVGALTNDPGETGQGIEINDPAYERPLSTFSPPVVTDNVGMIENNIDILFPEISSASEYKVTHVGLYDSQTAGNMWAYMRLNTPIDVITGSAFQIPVGHYVYTSNGNFSNGEHTKILNIFRGQSIVGRLPYMGAFNGNPDSAGTEFPTGTGYNRLEMIYTAPEEQASGQMQINVSSDVSTGIATTNWGNLTHYALMSASTGGEVIYYKPAAIILTYPIASRITIRAGEFPVRVN